MKGGQPGRLWYLHPQRQSVQLDGALSDTSALCGPGLGEGLDPTPSRGPASLNYPMVRGALEVEEGCLLCRRKEVQAERV